MFSETEGHCCGKWQTFKMVAWPGSCLRLRLVSPSMASTLPALTGLSINAQRCCAEKDTNNRCFLRAANNQKEPEFLAQTQKQNAISSLLPKAKGNEGKEVSKIAFFKIQNRFHAQFCF
eukprot:6475922-Amphidinium_carterae.1